MHPIRRFSFISFIGLVLVLVSGPGRAQTTLEEFNQIDEGFRLFTEETFNGNGRTCATCHILDRDYTISPADIAGMSGEELDLVLASNVEGLENDALVTMLGLFNVGPEDGTEEFPHGPFRSSMAVEATDATTINAVAGPIQIALGWSGDGAPNGGFHHGNVDPDADGTLRAFANGAIAQHNPKTLARVAGNNPSDDFRFATDEELDAMDAFQAWVGRRVVTHADPTDPRPEFFLEDLHFRDPRAEIGKELYLAPEASCQACHENMGAHAEPPPGLPPALGANLNLDTGMDDEHERLSALTGVNIPEDEARIPLGGFNIQSLIQAASKSSHFHNAATTTDLEEAIEAYFRPPFARVDGIPGTGAPGREILFLFLPPGTDHIDTVEDFDAFGGFNSIGRMGTAIRVTSAYYSLRDCERLIQEAIDRIDVGADPNLPAMHCGFNLDRVSKLLWGAQVFPRPHLLVRLSTGFVKHQVLKGAAKGKKNKLRRQLKSVRAMRFLLATTSEEI